MAVYVCVCVDGEASLCQWWNGVEWNGAIKHFIDWSRLARNYVWSAGNCN